jgi:hypothetical protein
MLELWYGGSLDADREWSGTGPLRGVGGAATVGYVGGLVIVLRRVTVRIDAKGSL